SKNTKINDSIDQNRYSTGVHVSELHYPRSCRQLKQQLTTYVLMETCPSHIQRKYVEKERILQEYVEQMRRISLAKKNKNE
ncbi:hypothetical protein RDABS01_016612, partial [Bienertia sinuspersici]